VLVHRYDGEDYLRGDCPYYYWTTVSLLRDHDLDLSNQIPGGLSFHFDQVALAKDGRVVPKHPITLPVFALPFVAVFGRTGALVFNVAQMAILVGILHRLARRVAPPFAAALAAAATATLSFLPHYLWNFSPDVLATAAAASAFLAWSPPCRPSTPLRDAAGGLLLGVACMAKPALVCLLPGAAVLLLPSWRLRALPALAGLAVPLAVGALVNVHLFGAPQVTGYDRIARLGAHGLETYSQRDDFGQPVMKGLKRQLRHPTQGLLATSAVTLFSWLGLPFLARRQPWLAAGMTIASAALILFFSTYTLWDSSHYGNRHLMPAVALAVLPLAALIDAASGLRSRPRRAAPGHPDPGTE
jgi:hypothetical protein